MRRRAGNQEGFTVTDGDDVAHYYSVNLVEIDDAYIVTTVWCVDPGTYAVFKEDFVKQFGEPASVNLCSHDTATRAFAESIDLTPSQENGRLVDPDND